MGRAGVGRVVPFPSLSQLSSLRLLFADGDEMVAVPSDTDAHAAAGLLVSFLMELPDPLLTAAAYDDLLQAAGDSIFDSFATVCASRTHAY